MREKNGNEGESIIELPAGCWNLGNAAVEKCSTCNGGCFPVLEEFDNKKEPLSVLFYLSSI